jgi:hypothetical protein
MITLHFTKIDMPVLIKMCCQRPKMVKQYLLYQLLHILSKLHLLYNSPIDALFASSVTPSVTLQKLIIAKNIIKWLVWTLNTFKRVPR